MNILVQNYYNLYQNPNFQFNEGINIIIGKNGSGKTTLIMEMQEELKHKDIPYYEYRNEDYEGKTKQQFLEDGDMKKLVRSIYNSEGQEIKFNFSLQVDKLGQFIRDNIQSNHTEVFVLMDGMDSGLSIDGIDEILDLFNKLVIPDCKKHNMKCYVVITANCYEFVRNNKCINVTTGEEVTFDSYENYRDYILR